MKKLHFLIIDPNNDFVLPTGTLPVPGAKEAMDKVADWIKSYPGFIENITVTLDWHPTWHIADGKFWKSAEGKHPIPGTQISIDDIENGDWKPICDLTLLGLKYLDKQKTKPITIWTEHCKQHSFGSAMYEPLQKAIQLWENYQTYNYIADSLIPIMADVILKGFDPVDEEYSAFSGIFNGIDIARRKEFIEFSKDSDYIVISGQAKDYCVAETVRDICDQYGKNTKLVFLTDALPVISEKSESLSLFSELEKSGKAISVTVDKLLDLLEEEK